MKRYLIRCMGTILCVITRCMVGPSGEAMAEGYSGRAYTLGNDSYTIRYYTGAAWYVGWKNLNIPGASTTQDAARQKLFTMVATSGNVMQPLVPYYHYSGYTGVAVSSGQFYYGRMKGGDSYSRGARAVGDGYQGFLVEHKGWPTDIGYLVYAPTAEPFTGAGCCYYSSPTKAGDARGFSYSGDGRAGNVCPCFYTIADKVYTGSTCAYYAGQGKDYCTGVGVVAGAPGAANIGTGDDTSKYWPAVIHNVYYCYTHNSCQSSSQYLPFDPKNGYAGQDGAVCHMIRIPIVGLWHGGLNIEDITSGSNGFFDPVLTRTMSCDSAQKDASCASGFSSFSYLSNNGDGCTSCPTVGSTISGPGGTSYSITGGGGYGTRSSEYGVASCYVQNPAGADSAGYYTLLTSAGNTLTCDYGS